MATNEIHVGDIGTVFERTIVEKSIPVDISAATTKEIIFQRPDGTVMTKAAAFSGTGSDGKLRYVTVADDLNQPGQWSLQVHVAIGAWSGHSDIDVFTVTPNLD